MSGGVSELGCKKQLLEVCVVKYRLQSVTTKGQKQAQNKQGIWECAEIKNGGATERNTQQK